LANQRKTEMRKKQTSSNEPASNMTSFSKTNKNDQITKSKIFKSSFSEMTQTMDAHVNK
jgi:hypothetical protein